MKESSCQECDDWLPLEYVSSRSKNLHPVQSSVHYFGIRESGDFQHKAHGLIVKSSHAREWSDSHALARCTVDGRMVRPRHGNIE